MLELIALLGMLFVGGLVIGAVVLLFKLLFVVFKIALIPIKIGLHLVVGLIGLVVGGCVLLLLGPVAAIVLFVLFLPVLIIGGLVWGAVALVT